MGDLTSSPAQPRGSPAGGWIGPKVPQVGGRVGRPGLVLVLPGLLTPLCLRFQNFSTLCIIFKMLTMVMYSCTTAYLLFL